MRLPKNKTPRPQGPTLLDLNRAAIADQLEKGQIDEDQAKKMENQLQRDAMSQLIAMKGGKRPKTKGQKRLTLTERRNQWAADQDRDAARRITESQGPFDPNSTTMPPARLQGPVRGDTADVVIVDESAEMGDLLALSDPTAAK